MAHPHLHWNLLFLFGNQGNDGRRVDQDAASNMVDLFFRRPQPMAQLVLLSILVAPPKMRAKGHLFASYIVGEDT